MNIGSQPGQVRVEIESSVLSVLSELKNSVFASKRNFTVAVLFVLYAFSNWSLSISNKKGYSIELWDILFIALFLLVLKTWITGGDTLSLFDQLLSKLKGGDSRIDALYQRYEKEKQVLREIDFSDLGVILWISGDQQQKLDYLIDEYQKQQDLAYPLESNSAISLGELKKWIQARFGEQCSVEGEDEEIQIDEATVADLKQKLIAAERQALRDRSQSGNAWALNKQGKINSILNGVLGKKEENKPQEEEQEEVFILNNEIHEQAPRDEMDVQANFDEGIPFDKEAMEEAQRVRESKFIDKLARRLADVNTKLEQYKVAVASKVQENTTRGEAKLQEVAATLGESADLSQIQQELQKVIAEEVEKSQSLFLLNDVLRNVLEEVQEEALSNAVGGGVEQQKKSVLEALPQELKAVLECPDKENLQLSFVDYVTLLTKYESLIGTLSHDQDVLDTLEKGFQGFLSKSFSPQQNVQQKETVKVNLENVRVAIQQRIQGERQLASYSTMEQKFNDEKAKTDALSKQIEGLQQKIQEAGAGNEAASQQITQMSSQVSQLAAALTNLEGEILNKDSKIRELLALQNSDSQEIEEKKQKYLELQNQIEFLTVDKDRRIGSLSDQVGDLLKQLDEAKKLQDQQAEAAEREAAEKEAVRKSSSLKSSQNLNPLPVISPAEELAIRKTTSYEVSMQVLEKSVRGITELFYDKFRNIAYFNQDQLVAVFKNNYGLEALKSEEFNSEQKNLIVEFFKNKFITEEEEFLNSNFGMEIDPSQKTMILTSLEKNFELLKTRLNRAREIAGVQQLPITSNQDEREANNLVDELIKGALTDNDDTFNRNLIALKKIMSKYKAAPAPLAKSSTLDNTAKKEKEKSVPAASHQKIKGKLEAIITYVSENMSKIREEMRGYLSADMRNTLMRKVKEWKKTVEIKNKVMKKLNLQSQNMWFTLNWHDGNDLDLIVKCPCGQKIYYGIKKCEKCGTFLEIDMNAGANKNDKHPVEHIYLQKLPEVGSQWEVYCNMFKCNNNKDSPFTIQIEHEDGRIVSYQGTLDFQTNPKSPVYTYTVGQGVEAQDEKLTKQIRAVIDQQESFSFN